MSEKRSDEELLNEDGIYKHFCDNNEENTVGIVDPEGYCRLCGSEFNINIDKEEYEKNLKKYKAV